MRYTTRGPGQTLWRCSQRFAEDVDEESKGALKNSRVHDRPVGNEQEIIQRSHAAASTWRLLGRGCRRWCLPELSVLGLPFYFKEMADAGLCHRQPHDQAGQRGAGEEGHLFPRLDRGRHGDVIARSRLCHPPTSTAEGRRRPATRYRRPCGRRRRESDPIGITEIAVAFRPASVDVQATVVTFYLPSGLAKVAPVLTRVELSDAPGIIVMNKAAFDKLGTGAAGGPGAGDAAAPPISRARRFAASKDAARYGCQGRRAGGRGGRRPSARTRRTKYEARGRRWSRRSGPTGRRLSKIAEEGKRSARNGARLRARGPGQEAWCVMDDLIRAFRGTSWAGRPAAAEQARMGWADRRRPPCARSPRHGTRWNAGRGRSLWLHRRHPAARRAWPELLGPCSASSD